MTIESQLNNHIANLQDTSLSTEQRQEALGEYGRFLQDQGIDEGGKFLALSKDSGFFDTVSVEDYNFANIFNNYTKSYTNYNHNTELSDADLLDIASEFALKDATFRKNVSFSFDKDVFTGNIKDTFKFYELPTSTDQNPITLGEAAFFGYAWESLTGANSLQIPTGNDPIDQLSYSELRDLFISKALMPEGTEENLIAMTFINTIVNGGAYDSAVGMAETKLGMSLITSVPLSLTVSAIRTWIVGGASSLGGGYQSVASTPIEKLMFAIYDASSDGSGYGNFLPGSGGVLFDKGKNEDFVKLVNDIDNNWNAVRDIRTAFENALKEYRVVAIDESGNVIEYTLDNPPSVVTKGHANYTILKRSYIDSEGKTHYELEYIGGGKILSPSQIEQAVNGLKSENNIEVDVRKVMIEDQDGNISVLGLSDTLESIAQRYNYTLEQLLDIAGNEDWSAREVRIEGGGSMFLYKENSTLKVTPRDNDADWVPPLMYQRNEAEQTIQFGDDGNPILNSPIDLYIQSITQSTQDPSLSGQEWLTGTQDYFLNWIEGYSDLTLDSFLTTTSDLLANNNDSNISNYYQNNSSNAYDDVFNGLLGNHKYSSSNSIQDAFNNLGIDYNLKLNDGSWWDSQYNGHLNQTTVNDTFFFNENTNFTLGFDNISGGYYGTGNNNNGLEYFSINLDYKAPINFFGSSQNHISPLTFDLDNDGIELSHAYDQNVYFDIDNDGFAEKVGWVNADDGQLAMDSNNNGNIDNITELYGDDQMPAFNKLGQHDSNNDGVINNQDTDFDKFLVWRDLNQNGISEEGELKTLTETGIKEISLAETKIADDDPIRWNNENFISATSRFTWDDAHGGNDGILADVHFLNDNKPVCYKIIACSV